MEDNRNQYNTEILKYIKTVLQKRTWANVLIYTPPVELHMPSSKGMKVKLIHNPGFKV